ncbi:hypothetical protein CDL15_Pgr020525 [Punica granatum]|uniref:AP2/ERF domain-containing protein n=1 Tax=Punica granatum TaxID=22663 RepID=A0A218VWF9_PUNGR|nr:hypothetical protein CDL15_Pgr020525 [Punica granatum]
MARKRKSTERMEEKKESSNEDQNPMTWDEMLKEAAAVAALSGARRPRKHFIGVRQRPSGRWVAEIKDTIQKIRVWLGTFETAKEAARAYDEAACLLRGANTRTYFWPASAAPESSFLPAPPSKVTNLVLQRLRERNHARDSGLAPACIDQKQEQVVDSFIHFLNDPDNCIVEDDKHSNNAGSPVMTSESCLTEKENSGDKSSDDARSSSDGSNPVERADYRGEEKVEEEESLDLRDIDFHFLDDVRSPVLCSPFEMAEEIVEPMEPENDSEEPSIQRMKCERKFSASLYAFSGIPECLKRKQESINKLAKGISEQLKDPNNAENRETMDANDGELSLWSSLDPPPICSVN